MLGTSQEDKRHVLFQSPLRNVQFYFKALIFDTYISKIAVRFSFLKNKWAKFQTEFLISLVTLFFSLSNSIIVSFFHWYLSKSF